MQHRKIAFILGTSLSALLNACAPVPPPPLTYLALERPVGPITTTDIQREDKYTRGGFYLLNAGFRPAPNVTEYLKSAHHSTQQAVLKNADIQLEIPLAIDLLLFGYNRGTDVVRVGGNSKIPD